MPKPRSKDFPKFVSSTELKAAAETLQRHILVSLVKTKPGEQPAQPTIAEYDVAMKLLIEELLKRLGMLCEHYGLPSTYDVPNQQFQLLALSLARDLIPGFDLLKVGEQRARPRSVLTRYRALADAIEDVVAKSEVGIIEACRKLSKQAGHWKNERQKNLQAAYYRHKAALSEDMARNALFIKSMDKK
jgi:hypothetical protein